MEKQASKMDRHIDNWWALREVGELKKTVSKLRRGYADCISKLGRVTADRDYMARMLERINPHSICTPVKEMIVGHLPEFWEMADYGEVATTAYPYERCPEPVTFDRRKLSRISVEICKSEPQWRDAGLLHVALRVEGRTEAVLYIEKEALMYSPDSVRDMVMERLAEYAKQNGLKRKGGN